MPVTHWDTGLLGASVKYDSRGRTPGNSWPRQELREIWLRPHPGLIKDILSKGSKYSRPNMFSVLDSTSIVAKGEEESRKSMESFLPMGGGHCVLLCETGLLLLFYFYRLDIVTAKHEADT